MKRLLFGLLTFLLLFFVASGVLYILGDALMQRDAEIERLQNELDACRE
jgi:hypothetical protein